MQIDSKINLSNKQITNSIINSIVLSFSELSIFTLILVVAIIFLILAVIFRHIRTGRVQQSIASQVRILQDLYSSQNSQNSQRHGSASIAPQ